MFNPRWFPQQHVTMAIASAAPFLESEVEGRTNMMQYYDFWVDIVGQTIHSIYGKMLKNIT